MARTRTTPTEADPIGATEEADALFDLGLELPEEDEPEAVAGPKRPTLGENRAEVAETMVAFPDGKAPTAEEMGKFKPMVWMAMKPGAFTAIVDEGGGESRGVVRTKTTPFCLTPPIHPHFYAQFAKAHVPKAPNGADGSLRVPKWQRLWECPPAEAMLPKRDSRGRIIPKKDEHGRPVLGADGRPVPVLEMQSDCRGLASYPEKIEGKATGHMIKTCPLANCPSHPRPRGIHHSVWMAHRFIAQLKNVSAIRAFVRDYDPRPDVASFAQRVIDRRIAVEERERGLGSTPVGLTY